MAIYKLKTDWNGQTHKDVENYIKQCFLRFISNECIILPNDLDGKSIKDNTGELSFVMYDNIQESHNITFEVECTNVRRAPAGEGSWIAPTSSSVAGAVDVLPIDEYSTTAIYKLYNVTIDQSKLRTSDHKNSSGEYDQTEVGANFGYVAAVKVTPIIEIEEKRFSIEKKPMFFELKGNPITDQQLIVINPVDMEAEGADITTLNMNLREAVIIDTKRGFVDSTLNYSDLTNFDFSVSAFYGTAAKYTGPSDPNAAINTRLLNTFEYSTPTEVPSAEENNGEDYFYDTLTYKAWWGNGSAYAPKLVKAVLIKISKANPDTIVNHDPFVVVPGNNNGEATDIPAVDNGGGNNDDPTEVPPEDAP